MSKGLIIGLVTLIVGGGVVYVVAGKIGIDGSVDPVPSGLSTGDPDTFEVPQDVQAFYDECAGKGGVIGGAGGVKAGLPTTEEGYTCWYENRDCWDFLTYSRERYMGGNLGCPEMLPDLRVPKLPAPKPTGQITTPPPNSVPQTPAISPTADELVGKWSGSGVLSFTGSTYCKEYTIDWSANITKVNDGKVSGVVFDSEGDTVGTLEGNWSESRQQWLATTPSDIFIVTGGTMDAFQLNGSIEIKNAWLPCDDITGQSGTFNGSKK